MRIKHGLAVLAVLLAAMPGRAAAQPESAVEVRLRSVNDLFDRAEYLGKLVDKGEEIEQVRGLVKQLSAAGKGIEGIDGKRPFGAYAVVTPDVASSPVVVMVPVADRDQLLDMLKERVGIVPQKQNDGTLKANVPLLNEMRLRFAHDYLYIAREAKHLDPKTLAVPKDFFGKDDGSIVSVVARLDRIPEELKTFFLGQFEHNVQEQLKKHEDEKNPVKRAAEVFSTNALVGATKSLLQDGKSLSVKLFADPKADELSAEVVIVAKDGSPLAKTVSGLTGKTSGPAGIVAAKDPILIGNAKADLTEDLRKQFNEVVDTIIEQAVKETKKQDRLVVRRVLDTLAPTLKSGVLDAAVSLTGPDAKGHCIPVLAGTVKDGKQIEKLIRDLAPHLPEKNGTLTFDVEKIGPFTLHKLELNQADPDFDRAFGTRTLWFATSETTFALSIEPDGTRIKAGLRAKAVAVPVFAFRLALAKATVVFNHELKPDQLKALLKDAFGDEPVNGRDAVTVTVTGGPQLTIRAAMKGLAFRLAAKADDFKNK